MTISFHAHSIFVEQPLHLGLQQRRYLVGMRFAVQAIELSWTRLQQTLAVWRGAARVSEGDVTSVALMTDLWSIIDNGRRVQRFLWTIPELKEDAVAKEFVDRWSVLKNARDILQHIDRDFSKDEVAGNHIFGEIFWVDSRSRVKENKIFAFRVPFGPQSNRKLKDDKFPISIPIDSGEGIELVVSKFGEEIINISELVNDIRDTFVKLDERWTNLTLRQLQLEQSRNPAMREKLQERVRADTGFCITLSPKD